MRNSLKNKNNCAKVNNYIYLRVAGCTEKYSHEFVVDGLGDLGVKNDY